MGAVFEEYEWFAIRHLGSHITEYYAHDVTDLFYNALGSLAAGLLLVVWLTRGWGTRRAPHGDPLNALLERLERRMARSTQRPLDRGEHAPVRPQLPRVLGGDWTSVVRDPIDLLRASFFVGVWLSAGLGEWDNALRFGLTFLAVLGARRLSVPRPFDLTFNAAMAFQAWGSYAGAFHRVPGYEEWTHFAVSFGFAVLLYVALVRAKVFPEFADEPGVHRRVAVFLAAMCLGYGVGVYYELYVWLANHALGEQIPVSWDGLTRRLGLDGLGAVVGAGAVVAWDVYGWGTRRRLPAAAVVAGG